MTSTNVLVTARYGTMLVNQWDIYVGASLIACGEFSEHEVELFRSIVESGDVVLDIGANIGAHTVPLAQMVGLTGRVIAFEPQADQFHLLCANVALNHLWNVQTQRMALGERAGSIPVPRLDPNSRNNFGGLSLGGAGDPVAVLALDSVPMPRLDFLKIDVEGMELSVLKGARNTIEQHSPVLYVEADRPQQRGPLFDFLHKMEYRVWEHTPPLWNDANWYAETECPWPEGKNCVSINWLCLPDGTEPPEVDYLRELEGA